MAQQVVRRRGQQASTDATPARMGVRISMRDFGPISEGTVYLKPLTIFVGPNNSGKSYAAMLVHSIIEAENRTLPAPGPTGDAGNGLGMEIGKEIRECIRSGDGRAISGLVKKISRRIVRDAFKNNLREAITGNFGADVGGLVRRGCRTAAVSANGGDAFSASLSGDITIRRSPGQVSGHDRPGSGADLAAGARLRDYVVRAIIRENRIPGIPTGSFYLPTKRSGLLQGPNGMSSGADGDPRPAGAGPRDQTGVGSDFVSSVGMLAGEQGPFYDLATEMEAEIMGGHVSMEGGGDGLPPVIRYRAASSSLPLHRASSTVSEMAPLSLYLKHAAVPGSLLIIEEPESSLHPANRVRLAKYIVRMIRGGLNVLLTTHSSIIVDEIGTYMRASKANQKTRKRLGFRAGDYLEFGEVAPYIFRGSEKSGYSTRRIRTNLVDGIPQEEFVGVIRRLYNRSTMLENGFDEK
ncbi:MAG: AAA family ATPase [Nitrosopumilus sp.]|nr:AAA family ATPase [Nitrosopumilus sp.]MDA7943397.1 AAA family ATPase [Nitrosopumilus sp.]MDA7952989.1 AAA family ATPase [Nitrosopumilus sp.]MDA7957920.1 AAA family ATPase [Nitrosopumilus sp.]MDA7960041.1 AAA family ATPase [Nitrosopumilus sp.]